MNDGDDFSQSHFCLDAFFLVLTVESSHPIVSPQVAREKCLHQC